MSFFKVTIYKNGWKTHRNLPKPPEHPILQHRDMSSGNFWGTWNWWDVTMWSNTSLPLKKITYITWKLMLGSDDPFLFYIVPNFTDSIRSFSVFPLFFRFFFAPLPSHEDSNQPGRTSISAETRSSWVGGSEMGWMEASRGFSFSRWWGRKGPSLWLFTKLWWFSLNNLGWWIILGGGFKFVLFSPENSGKFPIRGWNHQLVLFRNPTHLMTYHKIGSRKLANVFV